MKFIKKFLLVLSVLLLSLSSFSCAKKTEETKSKVAEAPKEKPNFDEPKICGGCHTEIFSQWEGSMHHVALIDPFYAAEAELAGKEAGEEVKQFCHSCHSPVGFMRGEVSGKVENASTIAKEGIFCDFCHTVKESKGIGNASYVSEPGNIKRGPFKDSFSPYHDSAFSELHTKAEFCGICHDVYHPVNKLPIEQTYTEWKNSPYAKAGIQCQDCHMTPGPGVTKPNPGKAANTGPDRPMIYTHYFVGANTMMPTFYGQKDHAKLAEERLKAAASVSIKANLTPGKSGRVDVTVANKGAGHYLPTGLTEMRQMWIHLTIFDAKGKTIYESGWTDKEGKLDPDSTLFNTVLGDKKGKPTIKIWEADRIISDNRIPPKKSHLETYSVSIPAEANKPFKVVAILKYRSAPQEVIDKVVGKYKFTVPITEMARAVTIVK